jgi:molecular chaperone GrpE
VLADFRAWLGEAAAGRPDNGEPPAPQAEEPPDLHTLVGQMVALRQEVNLQTRSARGQQEQAAEALRQLGQAVELLRQRPEAPPASRSSDPDEALRPLLKALVELHDALALAWREVQRVETALLPALDLLTEEEPQSSSSQTKIPFLARLFGGGRVLADRQEAASREQQAVQNWRVNTTQTVGRVRQLVTSMVTGYTMSVQRLERALEQTGLEPIPAVGLPFDPESMEAVEVVARPDLTSSEVIEEVRRGYLWRGRVFRCALVKVARPA